MQYRHVSHACGGRGVRCIENRLQFVAFEVIDQGVIALLGGDGVDLLRKIEEGRIPELQIPEERFEGREPEVTRADAVGTLLLQIVEEVENEWSGKLLDLDLTGPDLRPPGDEANQQLEGKRVAVDRMLAGPAVPRQMLPEERGDMGGEFGHRDALPVWACSAA